MCGGDDADCDGAAPHAHARTHIFSFSIRSPAARHHSIINSSKSNTCVCVLRAMYVYAFTSNVPAGSRSCGMVGNGTIWGTGGRVGGGPIRAMRDARCERYHCISIIISHVEPRSLSLAGGEIDAAP
jgi:hypothetical protein